MEEKRSILMDLSPTRSVVTYDDTPWVGSSHGVDADQSATLLKSAFAAAGLIDANGFIPSGVPIVRNAQKLYIPAPSGAPCKGHIAEQVKTGPGPHAAAALRWHGVVIVAQLPGDYATDFDADTDGATNIEYV
jgi:hypothetical protein